MLRLPVALLTLFFVGLVGCTSDPLDVDVSNVQIDMEINRMDSILFSVTPSNAEDVHIRLLDEFGETYMVYYSQMLALGDPNAIDAYANLMSFVADPTMVEVHKRVSAEFASTAELEKTLTDAFAHVKYHFSDMELPAIVLLQTGFYVGVYDLGEDITVSLEMYLGPEDEIVKRLSSEAYPQYLKNNMKKEYIPVDVMNSLLTNRLYTEERAGQTFASNIIYHGKMMHAMDAVLRNHTDAQLLKYSEEQLAWCEASEYSIWQFIVAENMLHSSDAMVMHQWVADGPFTPDLPRESPPKVGVWLGWQMVKSYLDKFPETTLKDLMDIDHQTILKAYKPKR